jgi:hypothetical protein
MEVLGLKGQREEIGLIERCLEEGTAGTKTQSSEDQH